MYTLNINGPRTDLWGTPAEILTHRERWSFSNTIAVCFLGSCICRSNSNSAIIIDLGLKCIINVSVVTGFETENKYRILNSMKQQVYYAKEGSIQF